MKIRTKTGRIADVDRIESQEDIDHISDRGFFGANPPKIGGFKEYLGPNDGGYATYDPDEVEIVQE